MRARWEGVRADLLRSVSTLQAEREFKGIHEPVLDRFESPSALVAYLTSPSGNLDEKDRIYDALVRATQGHVAWSELATAMTWLGLWPALDAIYRRKLYRFRGASELVSTIGVCFSAAVARADLTRIRRLAATLTMNTERDLTDELKRRGKDEARRDGLPEDDRLVEERQVELRFLAEGSSEPQEIVALRTRLLPIVGRRDLDLVLAVVLGESQREAGAQLGLSHDVARKRYERALDRIRAAEGSVVPFQPKKVRL
jgi:hypothetical protein